MGLFNRTKDKTKEKPKTNLKINELDSKPCSVTLSVEVPLALVNEETEGSYKDIQAVAKLPGFRAGKVPIELVKKNFEPNVKERVLERIIRRTVEEAFKAKELSPITTPEISEVKYEPNKPINYKVKVEHAPKFKLGNYKGLKLEKKPTDVTEDDISKYLDRLREYNAKLNESKDDTVKKNHLAVIDYEASINGKPVPEIKADNQLIDMQSPQLIAGLTDGILGMKVNEKKEIKVKFPDNNPKKEWAGKEAVFTVTLRNINEKKLPVLNEGFAKDLGCKDIPELKKKISDNLKFENEQKQKRSLEDQIFNTLLANHVFAAPESLINERYEALIKDMKNSFLQQGAPEEEWKKHEQEFQNKGRTEAERQIRLSYILSSIINAENITVSEDELNSKIESVLNSMPQDQRKKAKKNIADRKQNLAAQIKEEKLFKFLIDNAKAKEIK